MYLYMYYIVFYYDQMEVVMLKMGGKYLMMIWLMVLLAIVSMIHVGAIKHLYKVL